MMKLFAVRDVKADAFGSPIAAPTRGLALRSFSDACANERSEFCRYPDDYMLYELGDYDPNSGEIRCHKLPSLVATARSVVSTIKESRGHLVPEVPADGGAPLEAAEVR